MTTVLALVSFRRAAREAESTFRDVHSLALTPQDRGVKHNWPSIQTDSLLRVQIARILPTMAYRWASATVAR